MNTQNYFYLGYLVIWFVTFSYVFSISKRQKQLDQDIQKLKNQNDLS